MGNETVDTMADCAFSGTGRPTDQYFFPFINCEIDILQGWFRLTIILKTEILKLYDWFFHCILLPSCTVFQAKTFPPDSLGGKGGLFFHMETSLFTARFGIRVEEQCSQYSNGDAVEDCNRDALKKCFVCRFSINENIQYRGDQTPADCMGYDLITIEYQDFFFTEDSRFDVNFFRG